MCRPSGAGDFLIFLSQGLRPGLRYGAPPALWGGEGSQRYVWKWNEGTRGPIRNGGVWGTR